MLCSYIPLHTLAANFNCVFPPNTMDSSTAANIFRKPPMCDDNVLGTVGDLRVRLVSHKQNDHDL